MRFLIAAAALGLVAAPLMAQTALPAIKTGATLRSSGNVRIGTVDRVNADGSVQVIYNSRFVTIPADKLTLVDNVVITSLTKAEVAKLH